MPRSKRSINNSKKRSNNKSKRSNSYSAMYRHPMNQNEIIIKTKKSSANGNASIKK